MKPNTPPDWGNAFNYKDVSAPEPKKDLGPKVDTLVSKAVGFTVYAHDPRLLKMIVKWKKEKHPDESDNFLDQPQKVEELKKALKEPLK